jgi:2-polyprenyl-3-methyl-5-hydroxy-6-metoxy-1,4-benzoquinol methylase
MDPACQAAYTIDDQRRMSQARNYFGWQGRLVRPEIGPRVIEVGCGLGNFTEMLLDRDALLALDKEEGCIECLQQKYRDYPNVRAFLCDAEDDAQFSTLAAFAADSCVCLNVLEHVKDDAGLLGRLASVLAPGGTIVLIVPAFRSLYGPIDLHLGHCRRYTMPAVRELAAAAGLGVKKAHYMNAVGFFGWWLNSHILRREAQSAKQIELFDKFVVPFSSWMETITPPPFGQSIFAVLQKA